MDLRGVRGSGQTMKDVRPWRVLEFAGSSIAPDPDEPDVGVISSSSVSGVIGFGADPTGASCSGPAFQAMDNASSLEPYVPPGTYRICDNRTFLRRFRFSPGAIIKPDAGVTVTFNQSVDAGPYQIFDLSNGGGAACVPKYCALFRPYWWGAKPNINANDSIPWTNMFTAIPLAGFTVPGSGYLHGAKVEWPQGDNRVLGLTVPTGTELLGTWGASFFRPPAGTVAGTIITLASGGFNSIGNGNIYAAGCPNITLIDTAQASRVKLPWLYLTPNGTNVVGLAAGNNSSSRTIHIDNVMIIGDNSLGSIAAQMKSSDIKGTVMWVARCDQGFVGSFDTSLQLVTLHSWGNNLEGLIGQFSSLQLTNFYPENNGSWGAHFSASKLAQIKNMRAWQNGGIVANTGGCLVDGSSSNVRIDGICDDNTGTQCKLDGTTDTNLDIACVSSTVIQTGGTPLATRGLVVTNTNVRPRIRIKALNSHHLTEALLDQGADSDICMDEFTLRLAADTPYTSNVGFNSLLSKAIKLGEIWEIEALVFFDAASNTPGAKVRIGGPTGSTGRFAGFGLIETAPTSTTIESVLPNNVAPTPTNGVFTGIVTTINQAILIKGTLDNTAGADGFIILQAGQGTSNASATTVRIGTKLRGKRIK